MPPRRSSSTTCPVTPRSTAAIASTPTPGASSPIHCSIGYTQPAFTHWTFDGSVRYYWQTHANFYSDLFPYENSQNFMARDRELAQFHSITLGLGASWEFHPELAALDREGHGESRTSTACTSTTRTSATCWITRRGAAGRAALHPRRHRHAVLYFLLVLKDHAPPGAIAAEADHEPTLLPHGAAHASWRSSLPLAAGARRRATAQTREDARLITATQVLEELRATPDQNVPRLAACSAPTASRSSPM